MIDRSKFLLPLRRRTLLTAIGGSAVAWVACPLIAAVIYVAACIIVAVLAALSLALWISAIAAIGGGIVVAVVGFICGEEGVAYGVGGVSAIVAGFAAATVAPTLLVSEEGFRAMIGPSQLMMQWFIAHNWGLAAWLPAAFVVTLATLTSCIIFLWRYLPDLYHRLWRHFHDCPACHHRGRPAYACPKCRSVELDLRPSAYGIFSVQCKTCGTRIPTLDSLGRSDLNRRCGHCDAAWDHPSLGRLPVWHVVVAHCDRDVAPRTSLSVVAGRLVFIHESSAKHLASTGSASSLGYLELLDQVLVVGDELSLHEARPLIPGMLGVLERSTKVNVRRRIGVPAAILTHSTKSSARPPRGNAANDWRLAMQTLFAEVPVKWGGEDDKTLASLI
ncbi:MAG: hypothetical protein WD042_11690 [Phycisphaeraceae bacterium]